MAPGPSATTLARYARSTTSSLGRGSLTLWALRRITWANAAEHGQLYQHLTHPPFVEGIRLALGKQEPRIRSLVGGFLAGAYAGALTCCCGESFDHEQKLWWHIFWRCPLLEMHRRQDISEAFLRASRSFSPWIATAFPTSL